MTLSSSEYDENLMRLICVGDHQAFTDLVTLHTQRYFALAYRTLQHQSDAEDVVQSAFIKLWQKPDVWKVEKSKFTTWFYRVVLNACYDHKRKIKRLTFINDSVLENLMQVSQSEQSLLEKKQECRSRQSRLEYAIAELPVSQRNALNLVVYSDLPQKQAAEVLGISVKAIESLLVRAKRSIKNTLNVTPRADNLSKVAALKNSISKDVI